MDSAEISNKNGIIRLAHLLVIDIDSDTANIYANANNGKYIYFHVINNERNLLKDMVGYDCTISIK
jgi:hypothetical protein